VLTPAAEAGIICGAVGRSGVVAACLCPVHEYLALLCKRPSHGDYCWGAQRVVAWPACCCQWWLTQQLHSRVSQGCGQRSVVPSWWQCTSGECTPASEAFTGNRLVKLPRSCLKMLPRSCLNIAHPVLGPAGINVSTQRTSSAAWIQSPTARIRNRYKQHRDPGMMTWKHLTYHSHLPSAALAWQ
jgi:hypothetical protein